MELSTCQELLHRLRELEAENSALAQANENQRETYERCLDEVANHVVQALLNQKDLREECIKLKKRVFDLERQNQVLSALLQQKLQLTANSLPQIPLTPLQPPSERPTSPAPNVSEGPATSLPSGLCAGQREVCWEQQLRPGGPGPPATPPPALDALSPFLRKKAQILEVLRALEETDPLLLCSPATPWRPTGQGPGSPEPINGEPCGPPQPEPSPWAPYLLLGPGSLGALLHWERVLGGPGEEEGIRQPWASSRAPPSAQGPSSGPHCAPGSSSSSSSDEAGDPNEAPSPDTLLGALARKQLNLGQLLGDTETYLQAFLAKLTRSRTPTGVQVQRPPKVSLGCKYPRGHQAGLWCYLRGPGAPSLPQHVHGCRGCPAGVPAWPSPLLISGEKQAPDWAPLPRGRPGTPSALSSQRSQVSQAASSLREGPQPRRSPTQSPASPELSNPLSQQWLRWQPLPIAGSKGSGWRRAVPRGGTGPARQPSALLRNARLCAAQTLPVDCVHCSVSRTRSVSLL